MEDDLTLWKMEDDLNLYSIEEDLLFCKWKIYHFSFSSIDYWFKIRVLFFNILVVQIPCCVVLLFLLRTDMDPSKLAYFLFAVTNIMEDSKDAIDSSTEVESNLNQQSKIPTFKGRKGIFNYFNCIFLILFKFRISWPYNKPLAIK